MHLSWFFSELQHRYHCSRVSCLLKSTRPRYATRKPALIQTTFLHVYFISPSYCWFSTRCIAQARSDKMQLPDQLLVSLAKLLDKATSSQLLRRTTSSQDPRHLPTMDQAPMLGTNGRSRRYGSSLTGIRLSRFTKGLSSHCS